MGGTTNRALLTVDRLARMNPGETLWDTGVRGLCARRQTGEAVTFVVKYRTQGRRARWYKIGRWGAACQPADARTEAKKVIGEVAAGHDPQAGREAKRRELTVMDVLRAYVEVTGKAKRLKPRTIAEYTRIRDDIIGPKIGKMRASDLTPADVEQLHKHDVGDRPYLANRVLALIRAAYNKSANTLRISINPARGIEPHREEARDVMLSQEQIARLGQVMREPAIIAREGVYAVAAVAFLLLTGRRKEEALKLMWEHLNDDMTVMALPDHKASRLKGTVYFALSASAARLLKSLPGIPGNPYVFVSTVKVGGHFVAIDETWKRLCKVAGINGVTIHDLRRTHSSHAASIGVDILSTSKMLGHSSVKVTEAVYVVVDAKRLGPVANKVAGSLAAILAGADKRPVRKKRQATLDSLPF